MMYIPGDRSNRQQEFQMLMQGMSQLSQGLQQMQGIKEKRAESDLLAALPADGNMDETRALLAKMEDTRKGRDGIEQFLQNINPFGQFTGMTGVERGIRGQLAQPP